MAQDEFTKLFNHMNKRFDEMNVRLEEAARDREDFRGAIAELSAQVRDYHRQGGTDDIPATGPSA